MQEVVSHTRYRTERHTDRSVFSCLYCDSPSRGLLRHPGNETSVVCPSFAGLCVRLDAVRCREQPVPNWHSHLGAPRSNRSDSVHTSCARKQQDEASSNSVVRDLHNTERWCPDDCLPNRIFTEFDVKPVATRMSLISSARPIRKTGSEAPHQIKVTRQNSGGGGEARERYE